MLKKRSTQQTDLQPLLDAEYSADPNWTDFSSDSECKLEMDIFPAGKMVNSQ
jgi:hypothetical protein